MGRTFKIRENYSQEVEQLRRMIRLFRDGDSHDPNLISDEDREEFTSLLRKALGILAKPIDKLPIEDRALKPLKRSGT